MFCGDETGGVVVDVGAYSSKFGYSGDDMPRIIFPSTVGVLTEPEAGAGDRRRFFTGQASRLPRAGMEVKSVLDYGIGNSPP